MLVIWFIVCIVGFFIMLINIDVPIIGYDTLGCLLSLLIIGAMLPSFNILWTFKVNTRIRVSEFKIKVSESTIICRIHDLV